jgi:phage tail protein X
MLPRGGSQGAGEGSRGVKPNLSDIGVRDYKYLLAGAIAMRSVQLGVIPILLLGISLMALGYAGGMAVDIYRAEPVTVAATEDWLSLDDWHWPEETIDCVSYLVGQGDTLWSIAERYYPDAHTGEMVWAIRKASDLLDPGGPVLQPGQRLWIPDPDIYGVGRK